MSKETFSAYMTMSMHRKLVTLENGHLDVFLAHDKFFELALCLSYMTLSKEKIIAKELKNSDRMARLTKMVDMSEINKVFTPGFAKEMPVIKYAKENDNLWILDNIRDSIMHASFDIDEENERFLIDNRQYDRELIAEIPFSWFIAYAKNDILSKKILDKYTVKGFYYNHQKDSRIRLSTKKELVNNIMYRVNINGNGFNVKEVENRIRELFDMYSEVEISDNQIETYRERINKEKTKYNEKYLVSFYEASEKIKNDILKEFPNVTDIDIFLDNWKKRFINKAVKRLPKYYTSYDYMLSDFNKQLCLKSTSMLNYISNIIEYSTKNKGKDFPRQCLREMGINEINKLLTGEDIKYSSNFELRKIHSENLNALRSICMNVYGLSTLVINHGDLYSKKSYEEIGAEYSVYALSQRKYLEYAREKKNIRMKILDLEMIIAEKQDQYNQCKDANAKQRIATILNARLAEKQLLEQKARNLHHELNFERVTRATKDDMIHENNLIGQIRFYYNHFQRATTRDRKESVKKVISRLYDELIEYTSYYTYGYTKDMEEILTIIRNSFSHVGRIHVGKNYGHETPVTLNDYDNNNIKTGEVKCKYDTLIALLMAPSILKYNEIIK